MYRGKCPLCGAQLEISAGDKVKCSQADHFSVDRLEFEKAWSVFDNSPRKEADTQALYEALGAGDYYRKLEV
jgi:hypothetical protein